MDIWAILGIEATSDIAAIKKAYARQAAQCHPEEDPKGFQELHEAYTDAIEIARARKPHRSDGEEKPAPRATVFRAVPKNLSKLGNVRPASEEPASPLPEIVTPKAGPLVLGFHLLPTTPLPEDILPQEHPPPKPLENTGEYQFPKGNAVSTQAPEEMPPKEHMEGAEGYRFTKGGAAETPSPGGDSLPPEENAGGAPAYVFPPTGVKPTENIPEEAAPPHNHLENAGEYQFPKGNSIHAQGPEEQSENSAEYQFPKGSHATPPAPKPASPMRGEPETPTGTPLVFPGFMYPDNAADMNMPFVPLVSMAATAGFQEQYPEQYPQTREAAEHLHLLEGARLQCLEDIRTFLEQNAPEQAWYPLLLGADFTLIQYDGKFLLSLLRLCRKQLSMEMASALYMVYGFTSDKSLRKYPVAADLHTVLNLFLQLPQEAISMLSLSENLHRSDKAFAGLARLSAICHEPFVCCQAVRTPAFVHVKYQPYFLLKLAEFLKTHDVTEAWRQALSQTYQFRELPVSPCLRTLAEQLPAATGTPEHTDYNPAADNLLLDEGALDTLYVAARENMLELVQKTRKAFPQSARREPWEYVFTRQEFALVRRDAMFLAWVLDLLKDGSWPAGMWLALADAYAAEFAMLPQQIPTLLKPAPEFSPEEQVTASLQTLQHTLATYQEIPPENPSFMQIIKSMLRSV